MNIDEIKQHLTQLHDTLHCTTDRLQAIRATINILERKTPRDLHEYYKRKINYGYIRSDVTEQELKQAINESLKML